MKNETILRKAIEKAVRNGWEAPDDTVTISTKRNIDNYLIMEKYAQIGIIFSHSFAKNFWGEKPLKETAKRGHRHLSHEWKLPSWQYHLQEMVLKKEPFLYLKKFGEIK